MEKTRSNRLFGTDGIREQVGEFPLDDASIFKLGCALGKLPPPPRGVCSRIVMGRDTRQSGKRIEQLIAAGILSASPGAEIFSCGVIPTPGLSFITDHGNLDYGVMITASHNPYTDNGIKIFAGSGEKIPEESESRIADIFSRLQPGPSPSQYSAASSLPLLQHTDYTCSDRLKTIYRDFLTAHTPGINIKTKTGGQLKIVLDCAHGATYEIAPLIFKEAGIDTLVTHAAPDGKNINRECGSTYPEKLRERVIAENADLGIAFDGDGDRVIFMDSPGRVLNGDYALYMIAAFFLRTRDDFKKNRTVVGTVMGNLGLEKSLRQMGVEYIRTQVGDKYVYREMKRRHAVLGGEESGHTILRSFQKTGDGILTALYFLKSLAYLGIAPSEAFDQLVLYPQVTQSIRIKEKKDLENWDRLKEMIAAFNARFGQNSRLLIRYSGTEPRLRVMMESEHRAVIDENIGKFTELIVSTIGEEK
jgi:phosphoglucosamine mutase